MNRPSHHDEDHADLVMMYALQVLPASEAGVVEERIATCSECRSEIETLRPIVDVLSVWPTDVLRPPVSLWERLAGRIAAEVGGPPMLPSATRWAEPEWKKAAPGISFQLLATDTDNKRVSMLVRLAPNTAYPPHRHAGVEELHLLDGELMIGDRKLYPGDYNRAEPDTVDHRVWSETGCTCVLITSRNDILL